MTLLVDTSQSSTPAQLQQRHHITRQHINFLEDMRQMGILTGDDQTGKGGHHWIYKPAMNETSLKQFIAEKILTTLIRDFPEETKTALKKDVLTTSILLNITEM